MLNIARVGTLTAVMMIAACRPGGEEVYVRVACDITNRETSPTLECTVKQTRGKREAEACWDFTATCPNNVTVTALKNCAKVKGGGTTTLTIPTSSLAGVNECQGPFTGAIDNVTINGKKAQ